MSEKKNWFNDLFQWNRVSLPVKNGWVGVRQLGQDQESWEHGTVLKTGL